MRTCHTGTGSVTACDFNGGPCAVGFRSGTFSKLSRSVCGTGIISVGSSNASNLVGMGKDTCCPSVVTSCFGDLTQVLRGTSNGDHLPERTLKGCANTIVPSVNIMLRQSAVPPVRGTTCIRIGRVMAPQLNLTT